MRSFVPAACVFAFCLEFVFGSVMGPVFLEKAGTLLRKFARSFSRLKAAAAIPIRGTSPAVTLVRLARIWGPVASVV